jgi:hypothetical protein
LPRTMDSRHALMALAALVLVVGMAAPVAAQDNTTVDDGDDDFDEPEEDDNETDDGDDLNETEDDVNETEDEEEENETEREREEDEERAREGPGAAQGKSAQFDARLMTAINTVDALTEMAPSDESEQQLEEALEILRGVQSDTDTASLGPADKGDDVEDSDVNETEEPEEPENETVDEETSDSEEDGETGDTEEDRRGPSDNSNRPSFVNRMLSGLFG